FLSFAGFWIRSVSFGRCSVRRVSPRRASPEVQAMSKRSALTRRRFLQVAATAAASSALVACDRHAGPWRFFTPGEARTIEALCEQIIPADQDSGATWAGTIYYIDSQLVGHFQAAIRLPQRYRGIRCCMPLRTRPTIRRASLRPANGFSQSSPQFSATLLRLGHHPHHARLLR